MRSSPVWVSTLSMESAWDSLSLPLPPLAHMCMLSLEISKVFKKIFESSESPDYTLKFQISLKGPGLLGEMGDSGPGHGTDLAYLYGLRWTLLKTTRILSKGPGAICSPAGQTRDNQSIKKEKNCSGLKHTQPCHIYVLYTPIS